VGVALETGEKKKNERKKVTPKKKKIPDIKGKKKKKPGCLSLRSEGRRGGGLNALAWNKAQITGLQCEKKNRKDLPNYRGKEKIKTR